MSLGSVVKSLIMIRIRKGLQRDTNTHFFVKREKKRSDCTRSEHLTFGGSLCCSQSLFEKSVLKERGTLRRKVDISGMRCSVTSRKTGLSVIS